MKKYLILFFGNVMKVFVEDFVVVGDVVCYVVCEVKVVGVYVFVGGINVDVVLFMVVVDGMVIYEIYFQIWEFDGGFCVLQLLLCEVVIGWVVKIVKVCCCVQEFCEFGEDFES